MIYDLIQGQITQNGVQTFNFSWLCVEPKGPKEFKGDVPWALVMELEFL